MVSILTSFLILLTAGLIDCTSNLLAPRRFCGYQHTDDYNRSDHRITLDEFPWMAQLLYNEEKFVGCTGSIINNRYVLTVAHCLISRYSILTGVRLGDFNVTSDRDCVSDTIVSQECSDPVEDYDIENTVVHPNYRRISSEHNIGLIRLSKNVDYSEYIRPICLPSSSIFELKEGERLTVSGWGQLNFAGPPTEVKKKVTTTLVSIERCKKAFKNTEKSVTDANLCVVENATYTCQGDSGGPLMRSIKNQWEQVGILSFAKLCGVPSLPIVYVNLANYIGWISENLQN